ncbi:MAG: hypothetical protein H6668_21020 [Ardenticatenaceae bacterium]|nr:hypothetical protein [Ardenticatenaceae bacterium]
MLLLLVGTVDVVVSRILYYWACAKCGRHPHHRSDDPRADYSLVGACLANGRLCKVSLVGRWCCGILIVAIAQQRGERSCGATIIAADQRPSQSILWQIQRRYLCKTG